MTAGCTALHKLLLELIHLAYHLLTHGLAQSITLAAGEAGEQTREQHHLFLIDGNAVGILEIGLHLGDIVFDFFLTLLAGDKLGDIVHRTRAVEGVHGDEVLEHRRLKLAQIALHTRRLKLERTHRGTARVEVVGLGVVDRYIVDVYLYALR